MEWSLSNHWGCLRFGVCPQSCRQQGWENSACFSTSILPDKDLNITIPVQEEIQPEEWKFTVETFKDFWKEGKEHQVLTQWLIIDEPMDIMCQDVSKLLRAFLDSQDLPLALIRKYQSRWCECNNVRNNHFSSFQSGFGVGIHLKDTLWFCLLLSLLTSLYKFLLFAWLSWRWSPTLLLSNRSVLKLWLFSNTVYLICCFFLLLSPELPKRWSWCTGMLPWLETKNFIWHFGHLLPL